MTGSDRRVQHHRDEHARPANERRNTQTSSKKLQRGGKALTAFMSIAAFVAGALVSPLIGDFYEWTKGRVLGTEVTQTQVRQTNLVDYFGNISDDYVVEEAIQGHCDSSRYITSNPNAYGCSAGNQGWDPCLALENGVSAVCLTSGPWDQTLIQIDLEIPVSFDPSFVASGEPIPWALQIKDPRHPTQTWRCLPSLGATAPVSGNQPTWNCDLGDKSWEGQGLNELIVDDGPVWRILFHDRSDANLIEAEVIVAWY